MCVWPHLSDWPSTKLSSHSLYHQVLLYRKKKTRQKSVFPFFSRLFFLTSFHLISSSSFLFVPSSSTSSSTRFQHPQGINPRETTRRRGEMKTGGGGVISKRKKKNKNPAHIPGRSGCRPGSVVTTPQWEKQTHAHTQSEREKAATAIFFLNQKKKKEETLKLFLRLFSLLGFFFYYGAIRLASSLLIHSISELLGSFESRVNFQFYPARLNRFSPWL